MKKKHLRALIGVIAGIGLAAVHTVALQMIFFSVGVLGIIAIGFWEERKGSRFRIRAMMACAAHLIFLYAFRAIFPIKSVLVLVFFALIECIALAAIMVRRDVEESAAK
jgi:hypothetical protein